MKVIKNLHCIFALSSAPGNKKCTLIDWKGQLENVDSNDSVQLSSRFQSVKGQSLRWSAIKYLIWIEDQDFFTRNIKNTFILHSTKLRKVQFRKDYGSNIFNLFNVCSYLVYSGFIFYLFLDCPFSDEGFAWNLLWFL